MKDWVLNLPCNTASSGGSAGPHCRPLGAPAGDGEATKVCRWDNVTLGGHCSTGTFESPWRSLEMGVRMAGPWPPAFFGFQQSDAFTIDARVLLLLGVSEHFQALLVDGGRKDLDTWWWWWWWVGCGVRTSTRALVVPARPC